MENEIINRVANSPLVSLDLEQFHRPGERALYDIKHLLYEGLILREKDFRDHIRNHQWSQYTGKFVSIICSADAIVPTWAYMLLVSALQPYARKVFFGSLEQLESSLFSESLRAVDWSQYKDAKVVIKGCSGVQVPLSAYVEVTNRLCDVAASIMYGEPCSTVPVFKRTKLG